MIEFSPGLFRGPRLGKVPEGIKTVIDLQYDDRDIEEELRDASKFYWFGTVAFFPPDRIRVKMVVSDLIEEDLKPLYLHCQSGVDRTGYMVAKYRIQVDGWTKWAAFKEMVSMGMHPWFYWWGLFL